LFAVTRCSDGRQRTPPPAGPAYQDCDEEISALRPSLNRLSKQ
jgi:hypothetical protein